MQAQVSNILCSTLSSILEEDLESMCSFLSPSWLMTLYVHAVPDATVLRIWDAMFFEGSVALYAVAQGNFTSTETARLLLDRGADPNLDAR